MIKNQMWAEDDWMTLIRAIRQEKCILLLGPDAACQQEHGQMRQLTELLSHELARKIQPEIDALKIEPSNFPQVAQLYAKQRGRNYLETQVSAFYKERKQLTSQLHRDLAALPFVLFITSTPDKMLLRALQEHAAKEPFTGKYNFRGESPEMLPQTGDVRHPLVFYLYGRIDTSESLVLTEDDLLAFLEAVIAKNPPLPWNVLSELRDDKKSLLFLGFGFKHWYLRILLQVLHGEAKTGSLFALEQFPANDADVFQKMVLFYSISTHRVQIYTMELPNFVSELRRRYQEKYGADENSETLEPAEMETVFLCHTAAEKDQEYAQMLFERLAREGLCPSITPRRSLQGVRTTVEKAIHTSTYVVILQSQTMWKQAGMSGQTARLEQLIREAQQKWDLLSQKLSGLEKTFILENRREEKMRLDHLIKDTKAEREKAGEELGDLEKQIGWTNTQPANADDEQDRQYIQEIIGLALEHQRRLGTERRFIVPVHIENCLTLPELERFESIDVSDIQHITELIRVLKDERQHRQKSLY